MTDSQTASSSSETAGSEASSGTPLPGLLLFLAALAFTEAIIWGLYVLPRAISAYQTYGFVPLSWRRLGIPAFALPYALLLSVPETILLHALIRKHPPQLVLPVLFAAAVLASCLQAVTFQTSYSLGALPYGYLNGPLPMTGMIPGAVWGGVYVLLIWFKIRRRRI
ncbi:hypothetical protein [Roseibium litorale]|uniref:DUF2569 domain-containing protein n=1 Tax=Roseibium litorale TaxID=2803841 RepID=A0ABR9CJG9_9HYPH|nr:hypothetical protein [Roseibium litorale]MBD8890545.1 hypothetical protein [Roseibium litorale]